MKYSITLILMILCGSLVANAQDGDSKNDTTIILNGRGKIIIKSKGGEKKAASLTINSKKSKDRTKVETDWFGFDLGFNQYKDQTVFAIPVAPWPSSDRDHGFLNNTWKGDFDLKGKSMNVNFTIFRQRISLYKHYINFSYGLCYDINNWNFKNAISWHPNSTDDPNDPVDYTGPVVSKDSIQYRKNKLVTNYLQVPLLLRFETSPEHEKRNVVISAGVYGGYLVRSHTKQIVDGSSDKKKQFEDFNLNKYQYGLQGELGYRDFTVYAKYGLNSLTEYGAKLSPYTFGLRFVGL